jgi:transcriptional regulator with XRE-family HTH domain
MEDHRKAPSTTSSSSGPGAAIRTLRKKRGLTLKALSERTGWAVSTLSKMEQGQISLSYDKLLRLSELLGVEVAQLVGGKPTVSKVPGAGRRVVHRAGEGQLVETKSYRQLYLATELLNKLIVPMMGEAKVRTIEEFMAEFGDFIRHPGEEWALVLEGEIDFHTEMYAPLRLRTGDSIYFDSSMGHAYIKAADGPCRVASICSGRGAEEAMIETFVSASERNANTDNKVACAPPAPATAMRRKPAPPK